MKLVVWMLVCATAATAAAPRPEVTISARRLQGALQINANTRPAFRYAAGRLNLIQAGQATPERPISITSRECMFLLAPPPATFTMTLALTDRERSRIWKAHFKGTWNGKSEDCKVDVVAAGPEVPEDGIVARPPLMPALGDVRDAFKLPDAVKSRRDGKWQGASGPTAGPALGEAMYQSRDRAPAVMQTLGDPAAAVQAAEAARAAERAPAKRRK